MNTLVAWDAGWGNLPQRGFDLNISLDIHLPSMAMLVLLALALYAPRRHGQQDVPPHFLSVFDLKVNAPKRERHEVNHQE